MNSYVFSTKGKVKGIIRDSLFFGTIIAVSIFISRYDKLYYLTWLPILWAIYSLSLKVYFICTTTFFVDREGLRTKSGLNVMAGISWEEVKKIEIAKHKSKIAEIGIFTKDKKGDLILDDGIENYEELFDLILTNVKNFGGIEIKEKRR